MEIGLEINLEEERFVDEDCFGRTKSVREWLTLK